MFYKALSFRGHVGLWVWRICLPINPFMFLCSWISIKCLYPPLVHWTVGNTTSPAEQIDMSSASLWEIERVFTKGVKYQWTNGPLDWWTNGQTHPLIRTRLKLGYVFWCVHVFGVFLFVCVYVCICLCLCVFVCLNSIAQSSLWIFMVNYGNLLQAVISKWLSSTDTWF